MGSVELLDFPSDDVSSLSDIQGRNKDGSCDVQMAAMSRTRRLLLESAKQKRKKKENVNESNQ